MSKPNLMSIEMSIKKLDFDTSLDIHTKFDVVTFSLCGQGKLNFQEKAYFHISKTKSLLPHKILPIQKNSASLLFSSN